MSNQEKLQSYIARLRSGTSGMKLLNSAKDKSLLVAMKTAKDLHVRGSRVAPDALFVNSLEQKLLVMNKENEVVHVHMHMWQIVPLVGTVALITIFSWRILKPNRDINSGKVLTPSETYVVEGLGSDQMPTLTPQTDFSAQAHPLSASASR